EQCRERARHDVAERSLAADRRRIGPVEVFVKDAFRGHRVLALVRPVDGITDQRRELLRHEARPLGVEMAVKLKVVLARLNTLERIRQVQGRNALEAKDAIRDSTLGKEAV